jgi:hypothetical protein
MCGNNTIQKIHYQGSKLTLLSSIWMKAWNKDPQSVWKIL